MERLILRQPPDTYAKDNYGELITKACGVGDDPKVNKCVAVDDASAATFKARAADKFTDWIVYARRTDRGGKEGVFADIMSGNWQTRFDLVRFTALDTLNEDWQITDVDGRRWNIETVNAGTQSGGRLMWQVYCVRRKAK